MRWRWAGGQHTGRLPTALPLAMPTETLQYVTRFALVDYLSTDCEPSHIADLVDRLQVGKVWGSALVNCWRPACGAVAAPSSGGLCL